MCSKLSDIETNTVLGIRYVPRPIDSCFGEHKNDVSDDDSGYESFAAKVPPNRIFSNEWISVGRSTLGGYGIFAVKSIPKDTHFLLERPFIFSTRYSLLPEKYEALGWEEKLVFDGLFGFDRDSDDPLIKKWNANR